jgi:alkylhydroperoxidase family enzyme
VLWAEHVARNTACDRDDIAAEVQAHFSDAEFVELTAVCGLFGQSNRFQDSMRLPIEEQHEVDKIRTSVRADPAKLKAYLELILEYWPAVFPPSAAAVAATLPGPTPSGDTRGCRVPLLDSGSADTAGARFISAAGALLGGVSNAVKAWAHTPHVAKMFLPFYFAFERDGVGSLLPAQLRLMILLTTHHTHNARYMLAHHTLLSRAAGLDEQRLNALSRADAADAPVFSPPERAAIAWAALVATNSAKRDEAVFDELKKHFNDAEIVEMTALCAIASNADLIYNALRVPLESAEEMAALYPVVVADPVRLRRYLEAVIVDWPEVMPVIDAEH